jgi:Condensin II complex subunit CAP-H2 or CNDH2, C-term/Condensin II complex subunit CAP-H2 or CNDH2, N-terminal
MLHDSRVSKLLIPIKDLAQAWNIDIRAELEFLRQSFTVTDSIESSSINFAEAALLISAGTTVFGKKVESLRSQVTNVLASISPIGHFPGNISRRRDRKETEAFIRTGRFGLRRITIEKEENRKYCKGGYPAAFVLRIPLSLLPAEDESRASLILADCFWLDNMPILRNEIAVEIKDTVPKPFREEPFHVEKPFSTEYEDVLDTNHADVESNEDKFSYSPVDPVDWTREVDLDQFKFQLNNPHKLLRKTRSVGKTSKVFSTSKQNIEGIRPCFEQLSEMGTRKRLISFPEFKIFSEKTERDKNIKPSKEIPGREKIGSISALRHSSSSLLSAESETDESETPQIHIDLHGFEFLDKVESTVAVFEQEYSELFRNVKAWQESLEPLLEEQSSRPPFDLNSYVPSILRAVSPSESAVESFLDGCPPWEINRRFLSILILANNGNVELLKSDDGLFIREKDFGKTLSYDLPDKREVIKNRSS